MKPLALEAGTTDAAPIRHATAVLHPFKHGSRGAGCPAVLSGAQPAPWVCNARRTLRAVENARTTPIDIHTAVRTYSYAADDARGCDLFSGGKKKKSRSKRRNACQNIIA